MLLTMSSTHTGISTSGGAIHVVTQEMIHRIAGDCAAHGGAGTGVWWSTALLAPSHEDERVIGVVGRATTSQ